MADKPTHTAHFYEHSEAKQAQFLACRYANPRDAMFFASERDESGNGNASWMTMFRSFFEDVGLASPTLLLRLLADYNRWFVYVRNEFKGPMGKSYSVPEARKLLMGAAVMLADSAKSHLVEDFSLAVHHPTFTGRADLREARVAEPDMRLPDDWFEWCDRVSPFTPTTPSSSSKSKSSSSSSASSSSSIPANAKQLDVAKITNNFVAIVATLCHARSEEPARAYSTAEVLLQLNAVTNALMACDMKGMENRVVESNRGDGPNDAEAPWVKDCIDFALEGAPADVAEFWRKQFSRITGRTVRFFEQPAVWLFSALLAYARAMTARTLCLHLLAVLESTAKDLCDIKPAMVYGVLLTLRFAGRDADLIVDNSIHQVGTHLTIPQNIPLSTPVLKEAEEWYAIAPPLSASEIAESKTSNNSDSRKPRTTITLDDSNDEAVRARRVIEVDADYLTGDTYRGRGQSTLPLIEKVLKAARQDGAAELSKWTDTEIAKSHGVGCDERIPVGGSRPMTKRAKQWNSIKPDVNLDGGNTAITVDALVYHAVPNYVFDHEWDVRVARMAGAVFQTKCVATKTVSATAALSLLCKETYNNVWLDLMGMPVPPPKIRDESASEGEGSEQEEEDIDMADEPSGGHGKRKGSSSASGKHQPKSTKSKPSSASSSSSKHHQGSKGATSSSSSKGVVSRKRQSSQDEEDDMDLSDTERRRQNNHNQKMGYVALTVNGEKGPSKLAIHGSLHDLATLRQGTGFSVTGVVVCCDKHDPDDDEDDTDTRRVVDNNVKSEKKKLQPPVASHHQRHHHQGDSDDDADAPPTSRSGTGKQKNAGSSSSSTNNRRSTSGSNGKNAAGGSDSKKTNSGKKTQQQQQQQKDKKRSSSHRHDDEDVNSGDEDVADSDLDMTADEQEDGHETGHSGSEGSGSEFEHRTSSSSSKKKKQAPKRSAPATNSSSKSKPSSSSSSRPASTPSGAKKSAGKAPATKTTSTSTPKPRTAKPEPKAETHEPKDHTDAVIDEIAMQDDAETDIPSIVVHTTTLPVGAPVAGMDKLTCDVGKHRMYQGHYADFATAQLVFRQLLRMKTWIGKGPDGDTAWAEDFFPGEFHMLVVDGSASYYVNQELPKEFTGVPVKLVTKSEDILRKTFEKHGLALAINLVAQFLVGTRIPSLVHGLLVPPPQATSAKSKGKEPEDKEDAAKPIDTIVCVITHQVRGADRKPGGTDTNTLCGLMEARGGSTSTAMFNKAFATYKKTLIGFTQHVRQNVTETRSSFEEECIKYECGKLTDTESADSVIARCDMLEAYLGLLDVNDA